MLEAVDELRNPQFSFLCSTRNGTHVFSFQRSLQRGDDEIVIVDPGERIELSGTVENPLAAGRYVLSCWISRESETVGVALQALGIADFMVYGSRQSLALGLVEVDADVEAVTVDAERAT